MVFVIHAWNEAEPDPRVLQLVDFLRKNGYDAICDIMQMQSKTAIHFAEMMADSLRKAEKVIIVLSKCYKDKADDFIGGVGTEYRYVIEDITKCENKYILVSFAGRRPDIVPDFLKGRDIVDLSIDNSNGYRDLFSKLSGTVKYQFSPVSPQKTVPTPINLDVNSSSNNPHMDNNELIVKFLDDFIVDESTVDYLINNIKSNSVIHIYWSALYCNDLYKKVNDLYNSIDRSICKIPEKYIPSFMNYCRDALKYFIKIDKFATRRIPLIIQAIKNFRSSSILKPICNYLEIQNYMIQYYFVKPLSIVYLEKKYFPFKWSGIINKDEREVVKAMVKELFDISDALYYICLGRNSNIGCTQYFWISKSDATEMYRKNSFSANEWYVNYLIPQLEIYLSGNDRIVNYGQEEDIEKIMDEKFNELYFNYINSEFNELNGGN